MGRHRQPKQNSSSNIPCRRWLRSTNHQRAKAMAPHFSSRTLSDQRRSRLSTGAFIGNVNCNDCEILKFEVQTVPLLPEKAQSEVKPFIEQQQEALRQQA